MNKSKGNMYPDVTYTWNPIRGKCPHECIYCYMKIFKVGELRLDEKALKENLGSGNIIFVGSSTDMWAKAIPHEWIEKVLEHCRKFDNTYLFQSKNPERFNYFEHEFPTKIILGTTLETNRSNDYSKAPQPRERAEEMIKLKEVGVKMMISIEPIIEFDLDEFVEMIRRIKPEFVSIGADSKGHNLPEPKPQKVEEMIRVLRKFTDVKIKDNLRRITNESPVD